MRVLALFILLVLVATAAFATLNWAAFTVSTELSLGVVTLSAPLGLIMLGIVGFIAVYFLVLMITAQSQALLASRRQNRELNSVRERADQAEASKIAELRSHLQSEIEKQVERNRESSAAIQARIDRLDADVRAALHVTENSLTAYLGELGDRVDRGFHDTTAPT